MAKRQAILKRTTNVQSATKAVSFPSIRISPKVQEKMLWSLWAADWIADLLVAFLTGTAFGMFLMAATLYAYG